MGANVRAYRRVQAGVVSAAGLLLAGCAPDAPPDRMVASEHALIPTPVSFETTGGAPLALDSTTVVVHDTGDAEAARIAAALAALLTNSMSGAPSVQAVGGEPPRGSIHLTRRGADHLGPEAYELDVTSEGAVLRASGGAGLFHAVQTFRQLLPALVEYSAAYELPGSVPAVRIQDGPRYGWRGAMLDVARHFLTADEVKRFIDLMVPYKLNRLHLHLSDDQGWRVEIPGWPDLTRVGGATEVGGGPGGFYTLEEYADLVRYAADRYVTVVPEFDVPGHTNAALTSYAELNCDGVAPEPYTGTRVGFSVLCVDADVTWDFLDDVIGAVAAVTPGPWFHVGGDEVRLLPHEDYVAFIERVQIIVRSHGKSMVGWDETAAADLEPGSVVQLWRPLWPPEGAPPLEGAAAEAARTLQEGVERAIAGGSTFVLSPADRIYLDMKYDSATVLGLGWAGTSTLRNAYDWDPSELFGTIPETSIAGVEAPLWSETLGTLDDVEFMAFPRLAAVAELGWTPAAARSWADFRLRVAAHGPRWQAQGVNFRRTPEVSWQQDPTRTGRYAPPGG